jgi:hypothetical protein
MKKRFPFLIFGMLSAVLATYLLIATVKSEKCWHSKLHYYKVKITTLTRQIFT